MVAEKPAKASSDTRTITSLRIAPEILVRLKVAAARERVRVNQVIVDAIMDRLELLERRHRQQEAA
jgi:predicted HicB family RNase H-like nuclease